MAIESSSDALSFTNDLGAVYAVYTNALTPTVLTNALDAMVTARSELQSLLPNPGDSPTVQQAAAFDNFLTLLTAVRTIEKNLTPPASPSNAYIDPTYQATANAPVATALFGILTNACVALNNYFKNTYGSTLATYAFSGTPSPAWGSSFTALWRNAMNAELPQKIGTFTGTSPFSPSGITWVLPDTVELRVTGVAGSPSILNFSGTFYKSTGGLSEVVTAQLPTTRTTSTILPLVSASSPNTWVSVSGTPTMTGMQAGDVVELWQHS